MSPDNCVYMLLGGALGAAITAGVISFSEPEPVCQNEVFTVCLYQKNSTGWLGPENVHKSGKAECYAYPLKKYDVKSIYSPFNGKRVTNKSNPSETFIYKQGDYIRAENICTDSTMVAKED